MLLFFVGSWSQHQFVPGLSSIELHESEQLFLLPPAVSYCLTEEQTAPPTVRRVKCPNETQRQQDRSSVGPEFKGVSDV